MHVHILGPNLLDQSRGQFHVHAGGCLDVKRSRAYASREFNQDMNHTYDMPTFRHVVEHVYGDMIGENDPGETWEDYGDDIYVFPCASGLIGA